MSVSITCADVEVRKVVADHLASLQLWAPKAHAHIIIRDTITSDPEYGTDDGPTDGCMGVTSGLKQDKITLYLDQIELVRSHSVDLPSNRWFMEVSKHFDPLIYVLTHEWGHAIDPAPWSYLDSPMAKMFLDTTHEVWVVNDRCPDSFSDYGATGYREAWAEAFVEWHLSHGHTINAAARWFANRYGWYSFKGA